MCRLQFGKLGKMIAAHPRLNKHSKFLFIPGPDDAGFVLLSVKKLLSLSSTMHDIFWVFVYMEFIGPSTVLPRCALPKYLTEELQVHVPNATFSSNPCRWILRLLTCSLNNGASNLNYSILLHEGLHFYSLLVK